MFNYPIKFFYLKSNSCMIVVTFGKFYVFITGSIGYWETTKKGRFWRGPGYIGLKKASDTHSLTIPEGKTAWTLIFVGPNKGSKQFANYNVSKQNARKH